MSDASRRFLIAYDIVDDRRRNRVVKALQQHGVRIQFSVFFVDTRPAKLLRLTSRLEAQIDKVEDSVMICDLGPVTAIDRSVIQYLGNSREEPARSSLVI